MQYQDKNNTDDKKYHALYALAPQGEALIIGITTTLGVDPEAKHSQQQLLFCLNPGRY